MKKLSFIVTTLLIIMGLFTSCEKSDSTDEIVVEGNAIIVNYGGYSGAKGEFSLYNETDGTITNKYFNIKNNRDFTSNIQSFGKHNGKLYSMSNNADKIDIIDLYTFKQDASIDADIVKPRYFAAKGNKAYVSCLGNVSEWAVVANSYIAVIDLTDNTVKKFPQAGGFEGMAIVGDKLYAASYTKPEVAVFDLATEKFETPITIESQARHFAVDGDNLWVSHVSSYSIPVSSEHVGITCIDTKTNTVEKTVNIPSLGGNGYIAINNDGSKVYALGAESWPSTTTNITVINTVDNTINESFITGESFYGLGYNQTTDRLYVLISPSTTVAGAVKVYDTEGTLLNEKETGIAPQHVIFY